ncbi:MAG: M20/M25/M40 family metallo-hydrolase [Acidobacteria bacterium]|nr:M20/M25/M40 family metallo-hydrolase [Acidobacteriota bacterium]
MAHPLETFVRNNEAWLHEAIDALVSIESPTSDKAAVDRCGAEFRRIAAGLGMRVRVEPRSEAGDHSVVEIGEGRPRILLVGHVDTVWPHGQIARMPLVQKDGKLCGPGTLDMKVGVSMGLLATRAVFETARPASGTIAMLVTSDEETGSDSSRGLIEAEALASDAVLVLEPALAGGPLKTSRKGIGQYQLAVTGVSAHAGVDPGKGVSAIRELARQIIAVEALHDLDRGVSVNVGVVSGGTRPNVVPEEAIAIVDVRAPTLDDAARIDAAFKALRPILPGAKLAVTGGFERPPMERSAGVIALYEHAQAAAALLGQTIAEGGTGGGSDGNLTAALGVPTLDGLGGVGDGAHAIHEHVELDKLVPRTALLAALIARLLSPEGTLPPR